MDLNNGAVMAENLPKPTKLEPLNVPKFIKLAEEVREIFRKENELTSREARESTN